MYKTFLNVSKKYWCETYVISRYLSPEGTSIPSRSLHPSTNLKLHDVYQVVKPFPEQTSTIRIMECLVWEHSMLHRYQFSIWSIKGY